MAKMRSKGGCSMAKTRSRKRATKGKKEEMPWAQFLKKKKGEGGYDWAAFKGD